MWNVHDTAGTPRTRALAAALREELDGSKLGIREVARILDRSHTTISQWQNGKRVPHPDDVSALLAVIGVTGKRRTEILELARHAADPNWLAAGMSEQLAGLIECERTAIEIVEWSPLLVHGLLQTADYARTIFSASGALARHEVDERIHIRQQRQSVMTERKPAPPELIALIGEAAIRQMIGGRETMIEQLRHVLRVAKRPTTTLRVVPIGNGWHPGLLGPFALYNFARSPSIVHLEHHRSSAFLYNTGQVTDYKVASSVVSRAALSPADSAAFITTVINEMESLE